MIGTIKLTGEVLPLMPIQTPPEPSPVAELNKEIAKAATNENNGDKLPPLSADALHVYYLLFTFDSNHKNVIYQDETVFIHDLLDYHDEGRFHLTEDNIVKSEWTDSDKDKFDPRLTRNIGKWEDRTGSGTYLVWAEQLSPRVGGIPSSWKLYYQPVISSSPSQAVARALQGNGGN